MLVRGWDRLSRRGTRYLHCVNGGSQVRATSSDGLLNVPLPLINRSLSLQTRVALKVIERLGRLGGPIGRTGGEILDHESSRSDNGKLDEPNVDVSEA